MLINIILHNKEKYKKIMSKETSTIFKQVADQHQPIIEGKNS